jgi:hypothetical protein
MLCEQIAAGRENEDQEQPENVCSSNWHGLSFRESALSWPLARGANENKSSELLLQLLEIIMKFFRYRKPSLKTVLGVTKAKKQIKKELGITAALKPMRLWGNAKRAAKKRIGYESEAGRVIRDGLPKP